MKRIILVTLALSVAAGAAVAADWPNFRGPSYDGVSTETGLAAKWPEAGPKELWRVTVGDGFAGISAVDGKLYTMAARDGSQYALCLDAATGKELWAAKIGPEFKDRFGQGPRATPAVAGKVVYAMGGNGELVALSAADGSEVWRHDLAKQYGAKNPRWGVAASPLVHDGKVFVQVGGEGTLMVAFAAKDGKEMWRSGSGKAGYAMPLPIEVGDTEQVVFFTGSALYGVNPGDGSMYWTHAWKTSYDVNAAMPIFLAPDRLFVSSGYDTGAAVLQLAAGVKNPSEVWREREMKNQFSSSVLVDGHLYGFDNKILKCIDAATGAMKWRQRDFGHGSLMVADGKLIVLGEDGLLAMAEASPEGYRELGRVQVFEGRAWTVPTLAGGTLYVRDQKSMVALAVAE